MPDRPLAPLHQGERHSRPHLFGYKPWDLFIYCRNAFGGSLPNACRNRQVGRGKARRYQRVNLGRGRRSTDLTGPYFLRYSLADGTRPWEHIGDDLDEAIAARERKQACFEALDANVTVVQD